MVGMVNPEIDRRISKKWKKTKLPGKTSWKVPIWLFFFREWPYSEKIQFATKSNLPNYNFWLLKQFLKEHGCFLWLKTFKTFRKQIFSVSSVFFHEIPWNPNFISTFQKWQVFCFADHELLFTDLRSSALVQKRTNQRILLSFLR